MGMNETLEYVDQLSKFGNDKMSEYHKWFKANAILYTEIDKEFSVKLSKYATIKRCYDNCSKIAFKKAFIDKLDYVEGYTFSLIPMEHAFLIYKGKVVDPTLAINTSFDSDRYGSEYYGITIPKDILFKLKQSKHNYLPIPFLYWEWLEKRKPKEYIFN